MNFDLDESYFVWLYCQVADDQVRHPSRTYWNLLRELYKKEFIWLIPNDDNRIEDGKDLRYEFIDEKNIQIVDRDWMNLGCSMLELMIGLSRRLAFECEGQPKEWFWQLVENIGFGQYNDNRRLPHKRLDDALDAIIWRTYKVNGEGGLFPLNNANGDQREIELWYQMGSYILERT